MKTVLKLFLMVFLWCIIWGGGAFAQGRFIIAPYIETGWQRDPNFHKSETNTKTVDTYNVSPGFELGYTTEKSKVAIQYTLDYLHYEDQDDLAAGETPADDNDFIGHALNFSGYTQPTDRLQIGLNFPFMRSRDPANSDAASNATDRYKFNIAQVNPWLDYSFGEKFGFRLDYTNQMTDYSDDDPGEGEDSDQHKAGIKLYYNLNTTTSVDLDYQFWTRDYDKTTSDYDSHQVMMNLNREFNRFNVSVGAGYQTRIFDSSALEDIDGFVMNVSVDAAFLKTDKTDISLDINRTLNDYGVGDEYYTSTSIGLSMTHVFFEKIQPTVALGFQNYDYETSGRNDDKYYASATVDYLIWKYFSIGVGGGYEKRDSNEPGNNYDNKYVIVNAKFSYAPESE